jgi:hypothetical protein
MIGSAFRRKIITVLFACVSMTSFKSVAYRRLGQYLRWHDLIALTSVQLRKIDHAVLSFLLRQVRQNLFWAIRSRLNTGLYS